jgi:hypothetical protein
MKHVHHAAPVHLPVPMTALAIQPAEPCPDAGNAVQRISEVMVYSPGPLPCRCGHYLSEDFSGRLFCRGCEGTDPADITPRLPLCRRQR